eukprot:CAMPEP_0201593484 /NCGR_PEP_ID=MMETSP0190_2-20130828/191071_1 /ASSEMBLY_ACC=CAM_ASM_000263 /TAXON_ID=37353 /ORGANISM="Rosalina sp." /LENGTH=354 /DNA_ID=CAMNT_0048052687 /DNA_START=412 /DNA_END=1477 /DNA_ORIENTATION=-
MKMSKFKSLRNKFGKKKWSRIHDHDQNSDVEELKQPESYDICGKDQTDKPKILDHDKNDKESLTGLALRYLFLRNVLVALNSIDIASLITQCGTNGKNGSSYSDKHSHRDNKQGTNKDQDRSKGNRNSNGGSNNRSNGSGGSNGDDGDKHNDKNNRDFNKKDDDNEEEKENEDEEKDNLMDDKLFEMLNDLDNYNDDQIYQTLIRLSPKALPKLTDEVDKLKNEVNKLLVIFKQKAGHKLQYSPKGYVYELCDLRKYNDKNNNKYVTDDEDDDEEKKEDEEEEEEEEEEEVEDENELIDNMETVLNDMNSFDLTQKNEDLMDDNLVQMLHHLDDYNNDEIFQTLTSISPKTYHD